MTFSELGLIDPLLRALKAQGYTAPTPIQAQSIGAILQKNDILAAAQTGTGKTAAFVLPILQMMHEASHAHQSKKTHALVLTPTRELAAQVHASVKTYGEHLSMRSALIFGGVGIHPQISSLKKGVDIVVATPGRLLDLVSQKAIDLSSVEYLVLDEADRMLDMGFIHDIKKIVKLLPQKRQSLLFSATFSAPIKKLAHEFLNNPTTVEVAKSNTTATQITQLVHPVDKERKRELLSHIITSQKLKQVLIFTRTKHGANKLSAQLASDGITSSAIHGNKSQSARTKALADFKSGKVQTLVATDIAARGIDIDALEHVVNFELPNVAEDYVHRIGRTGRAGKSGQAVSLVCIDEHHLQRDIERFIKAKIPSKTFEAFVPNPNIKAQPIQTRSNNRPRQGHSGKRA